MKKDNKKIINIIGVGIGLAAIIGVSYYLYKKRKYTGSFGFKKGASEETTLIDDFVTTVTASKGSDESLIEEINAKSLDQKKDLQRKINLLLQKHAPEYELLVVDGDIGTNTKKAIAYLKELGLTFETTTTGIAPVLDSIEAKKAKELSDIKHRRLPFVGSDNDII